MATLGTNYGNTIHYSDTHGTSIGACNIIGCTRIDKSDTAPYLRYCTAAAFNNKDILCTFSTNCSDYEILQCGTHSFTAGFGNSATGVVSVAIGECTSASGNNSVAMGNCSIASGPASVAMGCNTCASGPTSFAIGQQNCAQSNYSIATGGLTCATGMFTISAGFSVATCSDYDFTMGNGGPKIRLQMCTGCGYFNAGTAASGADYAEMFHSTDSKCIPKGRFVSFKQSSNCVCPGCNDIIGITSATPSVMGDAAPTEWKGKYLRNEIGELIRENQNITKEFTIHGDIDISNNSTFIDQIYIDNLVTPKNEIQFKLIKEDKEKKEYIVKGTYKINGWVLNPDYDPDKEYIIRADRPEWNEIGLLGKLWVKKVNPDEELKIGEYVTSDENGLAVKSTRNAKNSYRIYDIGKEYVKVFFK